MTVSAGALSSRIAGAADRRIDPRCGQALGVQDRHVLYATVTAMDEGLGASAGAIVEGLLQGLERQITAERTRHALADDPPRERIDHERQPRERPRPRADVERRHADSDGRLPRCGRE